MSATVTVTDSNGTQVPLGAVSDLSLAVRVFAQYGRSAAAAPDLGFWLALGQNDDDPADDVMFNQIAGDGHGQVKEMSVEVGLAAPGGADLGTFTFDRGAVLSYSEDDAGGAIFAAVRVRSGVMTYTPAGGGDAIELNVFGPREGR